MVGLAIDPRVLISALRRAVLRASIAPLKARTCFATNLIPKARPRLSCSSAPCEAFWPIGC